MMEELTTLVLAAQRGDHDAFAQIIYRFQNMAYAVAYAMLGDVGMAQDAAQEAFMDAYLSLSKLRSPAAFPGWFRRIIMKHSDRQIRGKRVVAVPLEAVPHIVPMGAMGAMGALDPTIADPAQILERQLFKEDVHRAIAQLSAKQRVVTMLFYIQGYSQKEIAAFLEVPITTVKKRLYNARKKLKENMMSALQQNLQENKPSEDETFANKVQFFIALQAGDLDQIKKLVKKDAQLVDIKTQWPIASDSYYWPLGTTPLFWAAGMGDLPLLSYLLSNGADLKASGVMTPLHHAVVMQQSEAVRLLLSHGVDINERSPLGQTALHYAIIRQNAPLAEFLLKHGADVKIADKHGCTPMAWATAKGDHSLVELLLAHGCPHPPAPSPNTRRGGDSSVTPGDSSVPPLVLGGVRGGRLVPVAESVLGRVINAQGQVLNGRLLLQGKQPIYRSATEVSSVILESGLKIVDLLAPIKRGGHVGVFTPLAGVGRLYTQAQLMHSMVALHDGYVVFMGLEDGAATAESLMLACRGEFNLPEKMLAERMIHIFGQATDSTAKRLQVAETGLTMAEQLRQQGHDVLLVVQSKLALTDGVVPFLRANTVAAPNAAITTLYDGDHTVGLEPDFYQGQGHQGHQGLDAIITFDRTRRVQGLWPAIDPLRSYSSLLSQPDMIGKTHIEAAHNVQRLFKRYQGLHSAYEYAGFEALFYLDNRDAEQQTVIRARRLHRFLTQSYPAAELSSGKPGTLVSVADTVAGCRAILEGRYDEVAEEKFCLIGGIEEVKK